MVRRDNFCKVYDLTERVIPAERLNARMDEADTVEWACGAALDKLGFATSTEISAFWDLTTKAEAKVWAAAALADGRAIEIDVTGADGTAKRVLARPDVMDQVVDMSQKRVRILSPFDPALRDRKRAEWLFGYHYRIEIFCLRQSGNTAITCFP